MHRYLTTTFWTLPILIVTLLTACKNGTGPEQTNPEQPNPTGQEQETLKITSEASFSVDENQTAVDTITVTPNSDNLFSITDGTDQDQFSIDASSGGLDASKFSIGSSSGELSFNSSPDYENPTDSNNNNVYWVDVQVSDGDKTATQTMGVTVNNVDDTTDGGGLQKAVKQCAGECVKLYFRK